MNGYQDWHFAYFLNLLMYGFLLYAYIKTKDGLLRVGQIAMFTGIGVSLTLRLILIGFSLDINTINLITIIPSTFGVLINVICTGVFYFKEK